MRNKLIKTDEGFGIIKPSLATPLDGIPAMMYRLEMTMNGPLLIPFQERAAVPKKIYGRETPHRVNRIWTDYIKTRKSASTGIVLEGAPGSGKSILVNTLCNKAIDAGTPVIEITTAIPGDIIREVVNAVGNCVVLFDEVTETYSDIETGKGQMEILIRYLSEESIKGVLNLLVTNYAMKLPQSMLNRPGRAAEYITMSSATASEVRDIYATLKESVATSPLAKFLQQDRTMVFDEHRKVVDTLAKEYPIDEMLLALDDLNVRIHGLPRKELVYNVNETSAVWANSSLQYTDVFTVEVQVTDGERNQTLIGDVSTLEGEHRLSKEMFEATGGVLSVVTVSRLQFVNCFDQLNKAKTIGPNQIRNVQMEDNDDDEHDEDSSIRHPAPRLNPQNLRNFRDSGQKNPYTAPEFRQPHNRW